MTTSIYHRFSIERFMKTLTNYIFSESLTIEDYENIKVKKKDEHAENVANDFQKHVIPKIRFLSSRKLSGEKDEHHAEFLTPLSQKLCRGILIPGQVCFLYVVKL